MLRGYRTKGRVGKNVVFQNKASFLYDVFPRAPCFFIVLNDFFYPWRASQTFYPTSKSTNLVARLVKEAWIIRILVCGSNSVVQLFASWFYAILFQQPPCLPLIRSLRKRIASWKGLIYCWSFKISPKPQAHYAIWAIKPQLN